MLLSLLLYSVILSHGNCPSDILFGVLCPIPNVKGTNKSDNFRATTLCSVFVGLLDSVILALPQIYNTDLNPVLTLDHISFMVQEVVSFYNEHGSNVYYTLLDASKAFVRIC